MGKIIYACAVVFFCTVCEAQFFYNEEDQQPQFQDPSPQDNAYGYENPPATAQYIPSQQRPRVDTRYQPAPPAPPAASEEYERPASNRGRRREIAQRPRETLMLRPPPRPRVYSPSVFQNLDLGTPPAGVNIPGDSFLNVLRNDGRDFRATHSPTYQPSPPPESSFVDYPPAPVQPSPVSVRPTAPPRVQRVHTQPAVTHYQPQVEISQPEQYLSGPTAPPRIQRFHTQPAVSRYQPQAERSLPEPVDNAVQYQAPAPPPAPVQAPPPQRSSRRRPAARHRSQPSWNLDNEPQRPRRVFGPSVFENLAPGVAPAGIHVPEDSFLNILRNDRPNSRPRRNQDYYDTPPAAPVEQYAPVQRPSQLLTPVQRPSQPFAPVQRLSQPPAPVQRRPSQPPAPVQRPSQAPAPVQEIPLDFESPQEIQQVQPVRRRVSPQSQQQRPQPQFLEDTGNYQTGEEQPQVIPKPKPVQSRRRASVRRHRQYSGTKPRGELSEEEIYQPPKHFGPSVFEKIGLGEAPPGIHIPEDSFLNLLRGDGSVRRPPRQQTNQRSHVAHTPTRAPAPPISEDAYAYDIEDRRAPEAPPQRHQSIPAQQYQPVNVQTPREYRRPVLQEVRQPVAVSQPVDPPKRQRQRSRNQPVHAPQPQPVYEVPSAVYNSDPDLQEEDDILRYRGNNLRVQQQEHVSQRRRADTAPRHAPPPPPSQPVYEAAQPRRVDTAPRGQPPSLPPQPVYEAVQPSGDDNPYLLEDGDIPRRRRPSSSQRRTPAPQPPQNIRPSSHSRPPPPQPHPARSEQVPETRQQSRYKSAKLSVKPLPDDVDGDQIPGEGGFDYPTFHTIPKTSFSCAQQAHNGYYADPETSCQVVHSCQTGGVQHSFLCPNGTIFNQEKFSCQWWYKVNCDNAPSHYGLNDKLYKVPPPPSRRN